MSAAKVPQTLDLFLCIVRRLKVRRVAERDHLVPHFVSRQCLEQTHASVVGAAAATERVVFGVPRQLDHVLGQIDRIVHSTDIVQVANQPFVVVSEIVNLVRQNLIAHHVSMIDSGRCLLLPNGVLIAFQSRVNVPRHVPQVGNTGRRLTAQGG